MLAWVIYLPGSDDSPETVTVLRRGEGTSSADRVVKLGLNLASVRIVGVLEDSSTASPVLEFLGSCFSQGPGCDDLGKHEQPQDAGKLVRKPFISHRQSI